MSHASDPASLASAAVGACWQAATTETHPGAVFVIRSRWLLVLLLELTPRLVLSGRLLVRRVQEVQGMLVPRLPETQPGAVFVIRSCWLLLVFSGRLLL